MLGKVQLMASNKKTLAAVEGFPSRPPNALPAYQRIQSVIRKRIDSGQLQAGDPVPSERELAKTHRSEEHTSELQSRLHLVCRLLLEKKKNTQPYLPLRKPRSHSSG